MGAAATTGKLYSPYGENAYQRLGSSGIAPRPRMRLEDEFIELAESWRSRDAGACGFCTNTNLGSAFAPIIESISAPHSLQTMRSTGISQQCTWARLGAFPCKTTASASILRIMRRAQFHEKEYIKDLESGRDLDQEVRATNACAR